MKIADLNAKLRGYVVSDLSPTQAERDMVTQAYAAVRQSLGDTCYLVGSYARFTASRPMHDIDVIFVAGQFDPNHLDPGSVLEQLRQRLNSTFRNPTQYAYTISKQTHSITISFTQNNQERFAIDVVPAFTSGFKNEFKDDIYWVPEILEVGRGRRRERYEQLAKARRSEAEWWIKSDPRGYISAATILNGENADYRRATKLVKKWKHNCKSLDNDFQLKSFHVEQVIFEMLNLNTGLSIFEILFRFFRDLRQTVSRPQIRDRADASKFIDSYISDLTVAQKDLIARARDFFLIQLEAVSEASPTAALVQGGFHTRASAMEEYLFDQGIPVLTDQNARLRVKGYVRPRDGFRSGYLDASGTTETDRQIEFSAEFSSASCSPDILKWKVKNDNASPEPRGEITDHRTRNHPERTKYKGKHYVECYAIKNRTCIAKGKQNVVLK